MTYVLALKLIYLKVGTTKPMKLNSAVHKTAKVRLSTGRVITAYIPGKGYNIQQHKLDATKNIHRSGATQLNSPIEQLYWAGVPIQLPIV
jgi:hypothetical protein